MSRRSEDDDRPTRAGSGRGLRSLVAAALLTVPLVTAVAPPAADAAPGEVRTERVSAVESEDGLVEGGDEPAVSADGMHVAFQTTRRFDPEADLLPTSTDVYVRDRATGEVVLISRVPMLPDDEWMIDHYEVRSTEPSISATGRYVAFTTTSPMMGSTRDPDAYADTPGHFYVADVFVCDRDPDGDGDFDERLPDGTVDHAFVYAGGEKAVDDYTGSRSSSQEPSLAADASAVAWVYRFHDFQFDEESIEVKLTPLPKVPNGALTPVAPESVVHVAPIGFPDFVNTRAPVLSADGHQVVMHARVQVPSFAAGVQASGLGVVIGVDTRAPRSAEEELLSVDETGQPLERVMPRTTVPGVPVEPEIGMSGDGRLVTFRYDRDPDPTPQNRIRLVDRDPDEDGLYWPGGEGEPFSSTMESRDVDSRLPALSLNGRVLTYTTDGQALGEPTCDSDRNCATWTECAPAGCQLVARDVGLDRQRSRAGLPRLGEYLVTPSTVQTCERPPGSEGPCLSAGDSFASATSSDGGVIVFESTAPDLTDGDSGRSQDVFAQVLTPSMAVEPLDFGDVGPDTVTMSATQLHHGGAFGPASVTSLEVVGPDAGMFSVYPAETCTGPSLYAGESCAVSIRFTPVGLGERSAQLRVHLRWRAEPLVLPLRGSARAPSAPPPPTPPPAAAAAVGPVLAVEPSEIAFGTRRVLESSDPTLVKLVNRGDRDLTLSDVTVVAAGGADDEVKSDYRATPEDCTGTPLAPGATCSIPVVARPMGTGPRPATLRIATASGQMQLVALHGEGETPTLSTSPTVGPSGRPFAVRGKGFPSGGSVRVAVNGGHVEHVQVTAGADGTFTASLFVFNGGGLGNRVVVAEATDSRVSLRAQTHYLVVAPRLSAPTFIARG